MNGMILAFTYRSQHTASRSSQQEIEPRALWKKVIVEKHLHNFIFSYWGGGITHPRIHELGACVAVNRQFWEGVSSLLQLWRFWKSNTQITGNSSLGQFIRRRGNIEDYRHTNTCTHVHFPVTRVDSLLFLLPLVWGRVLPHATRKYLSGNPWRRKNYSSLETEEQGRCRCCGAWHLDNFEKTTQHYLFNNNHRASKAPEDWSYES